jgi:hypothetical protein
VFAQGIHLDTYADGSASSGSPASPNGNSCTETVITLEALSDDVTRAAAPGLVCASGDRCVTDTDGDGCADTDADTNPPPRAA